MTISSTEKAERQRLKQRMKLWREEYRRVASKGDGIRTAADVACRAVEKFDEVFK